MENEKDAKFIRREHEIRVWLINKEISKEYADELIAVARDELNYRQQQRRMKKAAAQVIAR